MFSGGTGTKEDPYLIGSVADLNEMRNYDSTETASFYKQICDIDFEWADWVSPRYFFSAYDGSNYKIMNINVVGSAYHSFFGAIYETLEDHTLKNIRIINMKNLHPEEDYSGGLSGMVLGKVKIKNCHLENVEIEGGYTAGGFVGYADDDVIIEHCSVSGKGTFEDGAGFVGANDGIIRHCRTNMKCTGTNHTIGGFVYSGSGLIEKCYAKGTINLTTTSAATGGVSAFVSNVSGTIRQCTTDVKIIGTARACSGFAGRLGEGCILEDCYGKGDIDVEMSSYLNSIQVGGVVQDIFRKDAVVRRCYFMGNIKVTTPETYNESAGKAVRIGGIVGDIYNSHNDQGVTTIKNCFSITPSVTLINRTTGTEIEDFTRIGRIWGYYTDTTMNAHNYALDVATYNSSTTFPNEDKTLTGKDGQDITISALRKKETYEAEGWDFENVWAIHPDYNSGFPYLRCFGLYETPVQSRHIKVYESNFGANVGDLKAIIKDITDAKVTDELNGSYTFQFNTVIDVEKSQYLEVGNICEVDEEYFRIMYVENTRNSDDTLTISVECEHVSYDLLEEEHELEYFTSDGVAYFMLEELLQGTEFTVGEVSEEFDSIVKTISIQEPLHRRDVLFIIAAVLGGEIEFNKFSISLLKRRGEDRGFAFRYKKNIQGISRIVNAREKVNGQPVVSYTVDAPLLETLLGEDEHYETGDTVKVFDSGLNIEIETRIVKKEYNPIEKIDGSVEIANKIEDITDSLFKIERSTVHKGRVYNGIRISAEDGFVAERSDKMARNTMNATFGNMLELGDGEGNYEPVFYVTIENDEAKLNLKGNAEFTGKILASLISASNIEGGSINIGNGVFTVDNTGHMVANSAYIQGLIEASEFVGGKIIITNEAETERVVLSVSNGFRFQAWDENAGEEGEWIDSIWMENGKGKFFGEIISSTMTGGLIRTAGAGRRVEISDNQIRSYNDNDQLHGLVTNNSPGNFGDWDFYRNNSPIFSIYNGVDAISLLPLNGTTFIVGSNNTPINLRGNIRLNGSQITSYNSKTANSTFGETEKEMLQETHNKLKQLLDSLNN